MFRDSIPQMDQPLYNYGFHHSNDDYEISNESTNQKGHP